MEITLFNAILLIAIAVSMIVVLLSWKRRPSKGAGPLSFLMLSITLWLITQTLQDNTYNPELKMLWYNLKFVSIVMVPVLWLLLTLRYAQYDKFIGKRNFLFAVIIPVISLIALWTNKFTGLFYVSLKFDKIGSTQVVNQQNGIWFWVHTFYSYSLILLGTAILVKAFFTLPKIYRGQAGILIYGAVIPWAANILTVFNLVHLPYSDITPLAMLLTGLLFFWALFSFKLFDLVPIARNVVIDNMKDLILVLDTQNRIVDLNPSAENIINKKLHSVIGLKAIDVLGEWSQLVEKYRDKSSIIEKVALTVRGEESFYNLSISQIFDKSGKLSGRLFVLRNITELEIAINEMKESREAAEAANKAKTQFLANMSHEIRTPMNAIIGISELMSSTELSKEQIEYISMIKNSADSLLSIVNEILDFSKIEAGRLEIEHIDFNLRELFERTIKSMSVYADNKNIKLNSKIDENVPLYLMGDPLRIKQILINLINNAIKFTNEGAVEVDIEEVYRNESTSSLKFTVHDTGIGIPEEKIETLFKSFQQLDSSTTRKYGGTGLGLTIVKRLVELIKGSIQVESKLNEGSTFSFTLPLEISNKISEPLEAKETCCSCSETSSSKDVNILLAEDNKVNQSLMLKLIEKQGWKITIADNGRIVLEKLETSSYDLILMDIQMPEMDGFETTMEIRKKELLTKTHIPIIALTANAMKGDKEKCLEAGMDDYLSKPIKSNNLYSMVQKYT